MAQLTKSFLDRVQPPALGNEVHWDEQVRGYGLRVSATGRKVFVAQGRVHGKAIIVTIGAYGLFSEAEARKRAQRTLQQMRDGVDPRDAKRAADSMAVTLGQVCDAYLDRPGKLRETSKREMRRHVERVFADWKDKPVVSITEDAVRKRHRKIMQEGLDGKRAAPASANASMVTLRTLLNFAGRQYRRADGTPLVQRNPVEVLKDHWAKLGTRTERYIDKGKVGAVWNALQDARADPRSRDALAGIDLTIFLLLSGARRDEAAALTWDRVNLSDDPAECSWHLDQRKRGEPISLPLSSQAVALLRERQASAKAAADAASAAREGKKDEAEKPNPFVFPSWGKAGRIMDARGAMALVGELVGKHLSLRDLRRSFSNIAMRECRVEKFRVDLLTGHKPAQADVTARNYLDLTNLNWLYTEIQQIGDWIEQQGRVAEAQASGANIVALRA